MEAPATSDDDALVAFGFAPRHEQIAPRGLRIDPRGRLEGFVAKDPHAAGSLIELEGVAPAG